MLSVLFSAYSVGRSVGFSSIFLDVFMYTCIHLYWVLLVVSVPVASLRFFFFLFCFSSFREMLYHVARVHFVMENRETENKNTRNGRFGVCRIDIEYRIKIYT